MNLIEIADSALAILRDEAKVHRAAIEKHKSESIADRTKIGSLESRIEHQEIKIAEYLKDVQAMDKLRKGVPSSAGIIWLAIRVSRISKGIGVR